MSLDRKFLVWSLSYVVVGMCLGIFMAASHDHREFVAHAHILLIGFALSLIYGIIHKLWLVQPNQVIAGTRFVVHTAAAITLSIGLWLLYGNLMPAAQLDPVPGTGAIAVLIGALLVLYMVSSTRAVKT